MDENICSEFPRMLNVRIYTTSQTKILKCVYLYRVKYVHLTKPDNYNKDRKLDSGNMILQHRERMLLVFEEGCTMSLLLGISRGLFDKGKTNT